MPLLHPHCITPLGRFLHRSLNKLVPAPCLLCGGIDKNTERLCSYCALTLPRLTQYPFRCNTCALPINSDAHQCGQCLTNPPAFTRIISPFLYAHPLDSLIHQFKYRRQLTSGKLLGQLLLNELQHETVQRKCLLPELLVPTPMHWQRRWQRGFNQTEILAHQLSNALNVPVVHACLQPVRTPSQKELSRRDRHSNMRHRFAINPRTSEQLHNAHIALIDDVVTTTTTVRTLSELLIKAGAKQVDVWALARTPDH